MIGPRARHLWDKAEHGLSSTTDEERAEIALDLKRAGAAMSAAGDAVMARDDERVGELLAEVEPLMDALQEGRDRAVAWVLAAKIADAEDN